MHMPHPCEYTYWKQQDTRTRVPNAREYAYPKILYNVHSPIEVSPPCFCGGNLAQLFLDTL